MGDLSRRSFLTGTAGAAGAAALWSGPISAAAAGEASADAPRGPAPADDGVSADLAEGVVLYVRGASSGDVLVMADDTSTEVRDPALVRAVARALKSAKG